jgi:multicomponent Na+:H+ antiporter subunit E
MNSRISIIQMTIILGVIYLALTGNFQLVNILFGFLLGFGISLLVRPEGLAITWRKLPLALLSALRYLGILFLDMLKSGFQVGRIILSPRLPINPGIITIEADCQSELNTALTAHNLTLTPGELVIEMDNHGELFVHCLDVNQSERYIRDIRSIRKNLLNKIFE